MFSSNKWIAEDKDGKLLAEENGDVSESIHEHHSNLHNHLRNGELLNCPVTLGMAGVVAVMDVCATNDSRT